MKKYHFLCLVAMVFFMASCQKDATYLKADGTFIDISVEGGEGHMNLRCDGGVDVEYAPDWIEASVSDSTLTYKIAKNSSPTSVRRDSIVLEADKCRLVIPVRQGGETTYLTLDKESLSFPITGGCQYVKYDTDGGGFKVEGDKGVKVTLLDGKIKVEAARNAGKPINGQIMVSIEDFGCFVSYTVAGRECPDCGGTGQVMCKECNGYGETYEDDGVNVTVISCKACGGSGKESLEQHKTRTETDDTPWKEGDYKSGSGKI